MHVCFAQIVVLQFNVHINKSRELLLRGRMSACSAEELHSSSWWWWCLWCLCGCDDGWWRRWSETHRLRVDTSTRARTSPPASAAAFALASRFAAFFAALRAARAASSSSPPALGTCAAAAIMALLGGFGAFGFTCRAWAWWVRQRLCSVYCA